MDLNTLYERHQVSLLYARIADARRERREVAA
jgi:hypothetical protein